MELRAWYSLGLTTILFILILIGGWYSVPIFISLITGAATAGYVTTGTATLGAGLAYTGILGTIVMAFVLIANKIIKNAQA